MSRLTFQAPAHEAEAFQWTGGPDQTHDPVWLVEAIARGRAHILRPPLRLVIGVSDGDVIVLPGDYVCRLTSDPASVFILTPRAFHALYRKIL